MSNYFLFLGIFLILSASPSPDPRNADAPTISTIIEQKEGSRISLRYAAIHWEPISLTAIQENPDIRNYYNTYIYSNMAELQSNIQLSLGKQRLDPGTYHLGFILTDENLWFLTVSNSQGIQIRHPMVWKEEPNTVPFLSMVFSPGVTDRDFIFNCLYGNLSLAVRWTITGIPSKKNTVGISSPLQPAGVSTLDLNRNRKEQADRLNPESEGNGEVQSSTLEIRSSSGTLFPSSGEPRVEKNTSPKASGRKTGGGLFRRLYRQPPQGTP